MKRQFVPKNVILAALVIPFLLFSSGCIYLVVGGLGAVGGYVVSPDTVEGISEHDELAVWDTAVDVVSIMGLIKEQTESNGIILAEINKAKVTITIISINQETTKLRIKARKNFLPSIALAQDVFAKIMGSLND